MKAPNFFSYFGGKYYLAPKLIPMFPQHDCYVEVFGGAGNVLIQKQPSKVEVFNDIDSDIFNLFRVLREDFDEFYRLIKYTPYSRETYFSYAEQLGTETDLVKRAAMWYCVTCQSFSGFHGKAWSFGVSKNRYRQFKNKIDRLPEIVDRLRDVQIENRDFEFILDTYDTPNTFFYLDPPYVPETRRDGEYAKEMTTQDHENLIGILSDIEGKVMLSGYQNDLYDNLGWQRYDIETVSHSAAKTRKSGLQGEGKIKANQKRVESVYMNYENLNGLEYDRDYHIRKSPCQQL